jgi:cytochrome c553
VRYLILLATILSTMLFVFSLSAGDPVAGESRYKQSCINCHGMAGKGAASYPKISGKEVSYITAMLETYRDGIEVGPNSSLMIMMAQPLTDVEIANLAAYLKDAVYQQPK